MENNNKLFKFINPNNNDMLSSLSGNDLACFLVLLDDYYLKLRDKLDFKDDVTFGMEIEFENASASIIDIRHELREMFPNEQWKVVHDISLISGFEVDSPVLKDSIKTWNDINIVCKIVKKYGIINRNAAAHVHVGSQILDSNPKTWLNLLKLWSIYENIIYRFSYGDFLTSRPRILEYAKPMSREFWEAYEYLDSEKSELYIIMQYLTFKRCQAINFQNVAKEFCDKFANGNTIEFRCPNGTLESIVWQNNINLFVKLLSICKDISNYEDVINKRHFMISNKYDELRWYDEIYLDEALEFSDIVFNNNLDKIYFLKQYLKSFQVCNNKEEYLNSKTMTKKMF